MSADPQVAAREADVVAARARLQTTLAVLKDRVNPPNVAHRAVESAKAKAIEVAGDGVETARRYPIQAGAAAAVIALLLVRKPLLRLVRRGRGKPDA